MAAGTKSDPSKQGRFLRIGVPSGKEDCANHTDDAHKPSKQGVAPCPGLDLDVGEPGP